MNAKRSGPILIVEDDAGMRGSLQFLLESYGFEVAAFAAAEELFDSSDGAEPACAVLDIHLPGIEGIALYEVLTRRFPDLKAIFITGHIDDQIRADAKRVRAVALLEKPFTDELLLDSVDRALAAAAAS
ncbi:MAG TPA: response regulator [Alphaproteobacteria bacterium]